LSDERLVVCAVVVDGKIFLLLRGDERIDNENECK
jgi:hypothetical protein